MSARRPPLCSVPPEVLDNIAYELVSDTPHGPPSALIPLLLTCKDIHYALSSKDLYAKIFKDRFDPVSVTRRAFKPRSSQYLDQLMDYCKLLQTIRSGNIYPTDIDNTLFMALIMMTENDGKNRAQLEWAGIDWYLDKFVTERMYESREQSNGWPAESPENACALWLMWMMTTEAKLLAETEAHREFIISLVLPYVLVPYRYASAEAPPSHFRLPFDNYDVDLPLSVLTAHGEYPIYRDASRSWSQVHYGSRPSMSPPLITIAAKLIYFSRREIVPFGIPPHLHPTRAHALQDGVHDIGPTQEDMIEYNSHKDTKLVKETRWDWWDTLTREEWDREMSGVAEAGKRLMAPSVAWDNDWWRMRMCHSPWYDDRLGPVYNPGTMTGLWQGRMLIPGEHHIISLATTPDYPAEFSESYFRTTSMPIYMRLQEHHCMAPNRPVPCGGSGDDFDDGLSNAYFPDLMSYSQTSNGDGSGSVTVFAGGEAYEYTTYVPGRPNMHDPYTCQNCIAVAKEQERIRARRDAERYEHLFHGVGLGSQESGQDNDSDEPDLPDHDEGKFLPCDGIQDIIFTGKTDERHGQAWNHYSYYGRVRGWDGLIGILRISRDPRLGNIFFYGYVVGGENFVGNWRVANEDVGMPAWESAFTMSKRDDD